MKTNFLRRSVTLLTILALVLTVVSGVVGRVEAYPNANVDIFNADETGKLTIHKYEYNITPGGDPSGTDADEGNAPLNSGASDAPRPLGGVKFNVYKLTEDLDALKALYNGTDTTTNPLPVVNTLYTTTSEGKYVIKPVSDGGLATYPIGSTLANPLVLTTSTDAADLGTVVTTLPLGLYLVIEDSAPDEVTAPVVPFLVSIPMTTVDGAGWLYDVEVYPKNGTTYGQITIQKQGNTVSETLTNVEFELQKKDSSGVWQKVVQNVETRTNYETMKTGAEGKLTVTGLPQGEYRFIETKLDSNTTSNNQANGYIMDGKTVYKFKVDKLGQVTPEGGTTLAFNSADVAITVPNYKADLEKQVYNNTTTNFEETADYTIGDTIKYKLTIDVPKNLPDLETFYVTDLPATAAIIDDVTSVTQMQYYDDTHTLTTKVFEAGVVSPYTDSGRTGFKVDLKAPTIIADNIKGREITIEYTATLMNPAVVTKAGNANTATLVYSDNVLPNSTDDPKNPNVDETPTTMTITDDALVFTFEMDLTKTFNPTITSLNGVGFKLYQGTGSSPTLVNVTKDGDGKYTVFDGTTNAPAEADGEMLTDSTGHILVKGLENGHYQLVETKTKDGYNLLAAPYEFDVSVGYNLNWAEDDDRDVAADNNATIEHHVATSAANMITVSDDTTKDIGLKKVSVVNRKGFVLPQTGSMGYLLFCTAGLVLVGAGAAMIFSNRKKVIR